MPVGVLLHALAADFLPGGGQPGAGALGKNLVRDFRRSEVPRIAIVGGLETQEIQQAVDLLTIVRLGRRGVVILLVLYPGMYPGS